MKERPILFSAPMVRAILAGTKTQTRRALKHQPIRCIELPFILFPQSKDEAAEQTGYIWPNAKEQIIALCPYGQPGDRLWVREGFSGPHYQSKCSPKKWSDSDPIWYWADGCQESGDWTKPKPSIHMPRWASRITLEVVSVRIERLADISKDDAMAEGIVLQPDGGFGLADSTHYNFSDPTDSYCSLWESINGDGSWMSNPFVLVIEFKRVTP